MPGALVEVRTFVDEQPEALAVGLARHHRRFERNQFVLHETRDEIPDHPVFEFEFEIHVGRCVQERKKPCRQPAFARAAARARSVPSNASAPAASSAALK